MSGLRKILFIVLLCPLTFTSAQEINSLNRADQINDLAIEYQNKSEYAKAISLFKKALDFYSKNQSIDKVGLVLTSMGSCYMLSAKYDSAFYFHRLALQTQSENKDSLGVGNSLLSIGNVHLYQSIYDSALVYYNQAATFFIHVPDSLRLASTYNNIGAIHNYIGNKNQVIEYWEKSLSIKEALKNQKAIAVSKNNLAELYRANNNLDKAKLYVLDAIAIKEKESNVESLATSYFNLAEIYKLQNRPDESFNVLQKTQALIKNSSSAYLQAELHNKLGNYFSSQSMYRSAIIHYKKTKEYAENGKVNDIHLSVLKSLENMNTTIGNYQEALRFSTQYNALKDSLLGASQQEKILELEAQYESKNKAQEIEILQAKNALQKSINDKYYLRIIYLISGLILLSLITFLLWRNVFLKRRNNALLEEKNKKIVLDLEKKNFLIKEIQHRIKNNLSIIDSLINLQLISNPDINPTQALAQAQYRIRSISVLYDLLYKSSDFEELTIKQYIQQLTESLHDSLGFQSRNITVVKTLESANFHKDDFINLGLIINELFTNASKYGFPNNGGQIFLDLKLKQDTIYVAFYHDGDQLQISKLKNKDGLGIQLIRGLTKQMKGKLTIEETRFTKFIFIFDHAGTH